MKSSKLAAAFFACVLPVKISSGFGVSSSSFRKHEYRPTPIPTPTPPQLSTSRIKNSATRHNNRPHPSLNPSEAQTQTSTSLQCQLLGMNCAEPTDFTFSFKGFKMRGGETDVHCHGWGLVLYEGRGIRAFHDPEPCSSSPIAELVSNHSMRTLNMISHIRYATQGTVCLENVHPFHREMWGIQWTFAHNGDVPLFNSKRGHVLPWIGKVDEEDKMEQKDDRCEVRYHERIYNPIGDTDSEKIFCSIINALKAKFNSLPSLPALYEYIEELLDEITSHDKDGTILNFLLGCGEHVQFAYSWPGSRPGSNVWNGLHYLVREPPFKSASLTDCDYGVDFDKLTNENDRVAVIATKPLTLNEDWIEFERGQLILFEAGIPHLTPAEGFEPELSGHGLDSACLPQVNAKKLEEDMRRYKVKRSCFAAGAGI